ncbi:MAG: carbohydrate porin [Magnetospirillum sp.]|nr:carbohydrate porin [Magnetospirillum sp.]
MARYPSAFLLAALMAASISVPVLAEEAEAPKGLWERDTLTGDWGGLRSQAEDAGLKIGGTYTAEILGNPKGGNKQRAVATGNLQLDLDADFAKLADWQGLTFHLTALSLHGRGLGSNFVGSLFAVRDIEAAPNTRIWSLWLQQKFAGDAASIRLGQMPWQDEFMTSAYGATFLNGAFGWPGGFSANLVNGGGGYPFSTTGARLSVQPMDKTTLLFGVWDGDPAAGNIRGQDPSRKNTDGLNVRLKTPPVYLMEADYGDDKDAEGLPAMLKLGALIHSGRFDDPHWATNGVSLGSPNSSGIPAPRRGNWLLYGVADVMLWRDADAPKRNIGAFVRLVGGPDDRNQTPYYADTGLNWQGLIEDREDDIAGIGLAYGRMSRALAAQDRDSIRTGNSFGPVRDYEMVVEGTYRAQITPWWTVVPDAQYIVHPGGGAAWQGTSSRIPDAWVLGLRSVFKL